MKYEKIYNELMNENIRYKNEEKDKEGMTEREFLNNYNPDEYDKPSVTTDMLVFTIDNGALKLLLAKRNTHPFINQWCLPGGFVKMEETTEEAAKRILKQETGLDNIYLEQLYTNSNIDRDPRMRVISTSYIALTDKSNLNPVAGEEITEVAWFSVEKIIEKIDEDGTVYSVLEVKNDELNVSMKATVFDIPEKNGVVVSYKTKVIQTGNDKLAFDHADVINMGIERLRNKVEYTPIAFNLVDEYFTLPELQSVYEIILGKKLYKTNFRRKIMPMVIEAESFVETSRRPAKLYTYNPLREIKER